MHASTPLSLLPVSRLRPLSPAIRPTDPGRAPVSAPRARSPTGVLLNRVPGRPSYLALLLLAPPLSGPSAMAPLGASKP